MRGQRQPARRISASMGLCRGACYCAGTGGADVNLYGLSGVRRAITRSLTAQISLSIAVTSIALVAGSGMAINQLPARELRGGNELIMCANLARVREDLAAARVDLNVAPRLVQRTELQLGNLHMALLDDSRRVIAASERFEVPLSALPSNPMPVEN